MSASPVDSPLSGVLRRAFFDDVARALDRFPPDQPGSAAIELLYLAQSAYGRLTDEAIEEVAALAGMEPTLVRGLAGFYTLLMDEPHGRFVIHVCTDLPCALRGAESIVPHVCRATGAKVGETSPDGLFTVRTTTCLAACDRAPVLQVNLRYFHDLTPERVDALVRDLRARSAAGDAVRPPYGADLSDAGEDPTDA